MIPQAIEAALTLPLAAIRESALDSTTLAGFYRAAVGKAGQPARGIYSRFIGAAVKGNLTLAQARQAYPAAKFWGTFDRQIAGWPANLPLDPRLAGGAPVPESHLADFGDFRIHVTATVTHPVTGESKVYNFFFHDTRAPTPQQIYDQARIALEDVVRDSPTVGGQRDLEGLSVQMVIDEFVQIGV